MRNFTEKNAPTSHNFSQRLLKLLFWYGIFNNLQ